jgi:hypothetical protein
VNLMAVDALGMPFYSSRHPTGSHGWGNLFDLGNLSYYSERFIGDVGATSQRHEPNTGSKKVSSIKRSQ